MKFPKKAKRNRLIGLKVRLSIEEGYNEDILTLEGTIRTYVKAPDGDSLYIVALDSPMKWGKRVKEIQLKNVAIWPVFEGYPMERLLDTGVVPAGFANVSEPLPLEGSTVDYPWESRKWDYFSRGAVYKK